MVQTQYVYIKLLPVASAAWGINSRIWGLAE